MYDGASIAVVKRYSNCQIRNQRVVGLAFGLVDSETPFGDQTFRQKAHLQRHETTHGVGVKVNRGSSSAQRRKRKRSARSSGGSQGQTTTVVMTTATPATMSANLQQRLARVSEQFGTQRGTTEDEDETEEEEDLSVNHSGGKSYRRKMSEDKDDLEDDSKTTVTVDGSNGNEVFQVQT